MQVVIFVNGIYRSCTGLQDILQQADLVIAADGGTDHCAGLGIRPDLILGDLDSISASVLETYQAQNVELIRHPQRKDAIDLELAIEEAIRRGAGRITIFGGLGGRVDMSLANIMLAGLAKFSGCEIRLGDDTSLLRILHPAGPHSLDCAVGTQFSLLPLGGPVENVTLTGTEYPLEQRTLTFGTTLGISNVCSKEDATVHFTSGTLLLVTPMVD